MSLQTHQRAMRVAPALLSVVGAIFLVLIAVYARPLADDFRALVHVPHQSLWAYVHGWWMTDSGRFSGFVLVWIAARMFGTLAVSVTTVGMLLLLWVSLSWGVRDCVRAMAATTSWMETLLLGLLATVATLATAPSLADTVGWFTGSLVYPVAFAGAIAVAALYGQFATGDTRRTGWFAVPRLVSAFVAAGFHEATGILGILAAMLGLVTIRACGRVETRRRNTVALGAAAIGAVLGTAANLLSPGSRHRASVQHAHLNVVAAFHTAWHNAAFFRNDIHNGVFLLALATGVYAWELLEGLRGPRARVWLSVWGAFLIVVPWLVVSALTAWAGSTESGDRSPFRTSFLFTGSAAIGLAMIVFLALECLPRLRRGWRTALLGLVLAAGGLIGFVDKTETIVRAERLRAQLVARRDATVKRELAAGDHRIDLLPAPLLTVYTQAFDLSFAPADRQRQWILSSIRQYYGIPSGDAVRIVARQPRDYCLPNVAASWVGVKSCQELAHASISARSKT